MLDYISLSLIATVLVLLVRVACLIFLSACLFNAACLAMCWPPCPVRVLESLHLFLLLAVAVWCVKEQLKQLFFLGVCAYCVVNILLFLQCSACVSLYQLLHSCLAAPLDICCGGLGLHDLLS